MAGINDDDILQVRERVDIVDTIAEHVRLKKSGRTFKGLCPFHNEKSPSFHVDPAKQLYHCFGCGVGGDVYNFVMATEGLEFPEAVEVLARRVGYKLTAARSGGGVRAKLLSACEDATKFYAHVLKSEPGRGAREYLKRRGLEELVEEFKLGYSPDWSSVIKFLKGRKIKEDEMLKAGIAGRSERGTLYDRFKGRLIFPILDTQGRPIGFGGRVLDSSNPKYLNSPETPLYHKGSVLYGLSQAKAAFLKTEAALVVEGYTDLLALAKAGVGNGVATLGTAFTENHLKLLSRFTKRITLVFDGDAAGLAAAERSSEYLDWQKLPGSEAVAGLVDQAETEIFVAVIPPGLDPADYISEQGPAAFAKRIKEARPLVNFLIDRTIERHEGRAAKKAMAGREAAKLISSIRSPVAKEEYMRYLADKLEISYDALTREINRPATGRRRGSSAKSAVPVRPSVEREFVKLVLRSPDRLTAMHDIEVAEWEAGSLRELATVLKSLPQGKGIKIENMIHKLESPLQQLVSELLVEPAIGDESDDQFGRLYLRIKELALERRINLLKRQLENTASSEKRYNKIFEELVALEYERRDLKEKTVDGGSLWVKS